MSEKTAYEASNKELIERLMKACARAGVSNSGLCFDPGAGVDIAQMLYLKGAVLARIERQKPLFKPGARVVLKDGVSAEAKDWYAGVRLSRDKTYTIYRVWYDDNWFLSFTELLGEYPEVKCLYPAERFNPIELVEDQKTASAR